MTVHDPDFLALDPFMSATPNIVDVGANTGQSIVSFKAMRPMARIVSFEPNPALADELRSTAGRFTDVQIHYCGLSDAEAEIEFHTPVVDGVARWQESSMNPDEFEKPWIKQRLANAGQELTFIRFIASVRTGDTFDLAPDILKIDVEGAESRVIAGLRATIERSQPVLLVENSDWGRVTSALKTLGYVACMPDPDGRTIVPFSGHRTNTIYLPQRWKHVITADSASPPQHK